jgi:TetR/AcrR family transcriptional regulator, tetracycline repressor protein
VQVHKRSQKQAIVDKATAILDDYGIADLTMRRLARELDVSPGALYWHFANKQQLLGAVADRILRPACADPGPADWRARIADVGSHLRDALLSHTDGAELVSASFAAGESAALTQILQRLTDAAARAGVGHPQAGLAARTVVYYVLGFTAEEQSRLQWDASGAALAGDIPTGAALAGDIPTGAALAGGQAGPALSADPSSRFAFGLRLLVDGIAAHSSHAVS